MPQSTTFTGQTTELVAPSGQLLTDVLLSGSKWGTGGLGSGATVSFSFPAQLAQFDASAGVPGNYHEAEPAGFGSGAYLAGFAPFTDAARGAARAVLASWAEVANLKFTEVDAATPADGALRFEFTAPPGLSESTYGVSWFPMDTAASGDTWINSRLLFPEGWAAGTQNFLTLLHESGHALGLKHPHDTGMDGVLPGWPSNPATLPKVGTDTLTEYSTEDMVMAYNDLPGAGGLLQVDFAATTPMRLDIAAMQYLYGANLAHNAGNTVYRFDDAGRYNQTIWDGGGTDTIEALGARGVVIDLRPGHWSELGQPLTYSERDAALNVVAARPDLTNPKTVYVYDTVTIENASGAAGPDTITGNDAANRLEGRGGDDTLAGGGGLDTAVYAGARAGYAVARAADGRWTVVDRSGADGSDTLAGVERLRFADKGLALDTTADGHAGQAAQIVRALLGSSFLANADVVGLALGALDQGMGYAPLVAAAIGSDFFAQLAGSHSNEAFIRQLVRNLTGAEPAAPDLATYVGLLDGGGYTQAALGVAACQLALNTGSVELVGIAQNGLEFALAGAG